MGKPPQGRTPSHARLGGEPGSGQGHCRGARLLPPDNTRHPLRSLGSRHDRHHSGWRGRSSSPHPAVGGLAWRKARQRRVAKALEIDTPNGIVEQRFVKVGGIDQWIQIRGEDRDNPVLLVLHGGPGWPNAVFTLPLRSWERHFTVVQWDHRGAGKTLGRNGKAGSGQMTFERRVADAIELIAFLRQLSGHRQGDRAGRVDGHPDRPAPGQAPARPGPRLGGHRPVRRHGRQRGRQVPADPGAATGGGQPQGRGRPGTDRGRPDPLGPARLEHQHGLGVQDQRAHAQPGPPGCCSRWPCRRPIYSLRDLSSLFVGFQWSTAQMFEELMAYDARRLGTRFEVPFFLFQGETDVVTLTSLARSTSRRWRRRPRGWR